MDKSLSVRLEKLFVVWKLFRDIRENTSILKNTFSFAFVKKIYNDSKDDDRKAKLSKKRNS